MNKANCLECKHSSHKCKDRLTPSGWIIYCEFYEEIFDRIRACEHYQKKSSNKQ